MGHQRKFQRQLSPGQEKFTNLFIRGLNQTTTKESLEEFFSKFGEIQSTRLITDPQGKFKGTALVNYKESESAHKCVFEMNGKQMPDGSLIYVSKHLNKREMMHQMNNQNSHVN
jgi:polyadenylate-binding protein